MQTGKEQRQSLHRSQSSESRFLDELFKVLDPVSQPYKPTDGFPSSQSTSYRFFPSYPELPSRSFPSPSPSPSLSLFVPLSSGLALSLLASMSTRLRSQNRLSAAVITMRNNRTVQNRFVHHVRQPSVFLLLVSILFLLHSSSSSSFACFFFISLFHSCI